MYAVLWGYGLGLNVVQETCIVKHACEAETKIGVQYGTYGWKLKFMTSQSYNIFAYLFR